MKHDEILDVLGDGTRRVILTMIRDKDRSVGELAAALPVSQPAVSQHLRVLLDAGLVDVRKDGRRRIYRMRLEGLEPLRRYVSSFWEQALDAFRASFETVDEEEEGQG